MQEHHSARQIQALTEKFRDLWLEHYVEPQQQPLLTYEEPAQIAERFFREQPPQEGIGIDAALDLFRDQILPASVKTWHPSFFNQMSGGASLPAVLAESLAAMLNGTTSTYEASPAATVVERTVTRWMAGLLGLPSGSGGIFVPGGSLGNLFGLIVARNNRLPGQVQREGLLNQKQKPVILCSDAAHYSVANAANMMGLGANQLVKVATNHRNEMCVADLADRLAACDRENQLPIAIVVTLGSTVTGGFDPLPAIAELCRPRNIHIHVDAAFGGSIALTDAGPKRLQGIELADTVTWDAHKWLHAPLACSVLLAPDVSLLKRTFQARDAEYLFHHPDDPASLTEDLGHYTPLCGKPFNALGLWILFHALGESGIRHHAQTRLDLTRAAYTRLTANPHFETAYEPVSPVLCFRFVPQGTAALDDRVLDTLQQKIREVIRREGRALFNIAKIKGRTYFRFILVNDLTTEPHLEALFTHIEKVGLLLLPSLVPQEVG